MYESVYICYHCDAISVYFAAGMKFNKASLAQVAHVVADVELDPHIIG